MSLHLKPPPPKLAYPVFLIFSVFLLGEILTRLFFPMDPLRNVLDRSQEHPYIRTDWVPNFAKEYRVDGLTMPSGSIEFKINPFGFRGQSMKTVRKPEGTTRLFFLGGSTTECLFLPEEKTFAGLVEKKLSAAFSEKHFETINQGISGYLAADSLAALLYKVLYYEPDMVIVMHGINDMRYGLTSFYDPLRRRGYDKNLYRPDYKEPLGVSFSNILKRSHFLTLIKWRIWNRFFPTEAERFKSAFLDLEEKRKLRRQIPFSEPRPSKGLDGFLKNLKEIIWICKGHGIRLILMTESSIYQPAPPPEIESKLWMGLIQRGASPVNFSTPFLSEQMNRFNEAVRDLAKKEEIELIDLERNIPKSTDYFYDDAHLTEKGAALASEIISRYLIQNPKKPSKI